jgi:chromosomal replication initiator protein
MISPYVFPGIKNLHKTSKDLRYKKNLETPRQILEIVSETCGITVEQILSRTRKSETVDARYIFCGIMKKYFNYPYKNIGDHVGGRDHTTIIHAVRTFENRCILEDGYSELVETIIYNLNSKLK